MEKILKNGAVNRLPVINFHAAGIDAGSTLMVVSYTNAAGVLYRRLSTTKGSKTAIKAVARKPGILFYTPVKNRAAYDFRIAAERIKLQTGRDVRRLHKMARKLGYDVKKIA
jgi:hypothetical protein